MYSALLIIVIYMTRSCVEMHLATTVCISFNGHSRAGHIYLITVTVNAVNVVGSGWSGTCTLPHIHYTVR